MPALAHGLSSSDDTSLRTPPLVRACGEIPTEPNLRRIPPVKALYPDRRFYELAIYDVRIPGAAERLHNERAAWQEQSDIEALDQNHFVLIVQPGGARRLAP